MNKVLFYYFLIFFLGILMFYQYYKLTKKHNEFKTYINSLKYENTLLNEQIDYILKFNTGNSLINEIQSEFKKDTSLIFLSVKNSYCDLCLTKTIEELQTITTLRKIKLVLLTDSIGIKQLKQKLYFEKINVPVYICNSINDFMADLFLIRKKSDTYLILPVPKKNEKTIFKRYFLEM